MKYLIAALTPIFWGSTYAIVNLWLTDLSPLWVATWRALPAGIILILLTPKSLRTLPVSAGKLTGLSLLNITAFFALLFIAAYRLPGSVAGTLTSTLPLQLLLLNWLFNKIRPAWSWLSLSTLGVAGIVLLLNPSANLDPIGVMAALGATLLIATSATWVQRWQVENIIGLTAWQLLIGGLLLVPLAWIVEGPVQIPAIDQVPALLWLSLVNTLLAYLIWFWSLKHLGSHIIGLLALLNPITAVGLGLLLVGESLSFIQWLGVALVLSALILMKVINRKSLVKAKSLKGTASTKVSFRERSST
ncbi:EamA family transporter [Endozoicomonas sp. SM1973]|uniref:EamA family transporter n=1 Tax=Spartinivicinus marinus TaxID=2994442 RepID=A0A853I7N5_9GAMM|nr:EamA family transporter [Spartinivicinus marinus]MCX4029092.1 EamA family transporter [Spartinivicinus marinus]NYZ67712.1 EamA family transporter [Spartinivicinus marinus]